MMTRSVRDSALMLQATSGYDPKDEYSAQVAVPNFSAKIGQDIRGMRVAYAHGYTYDGIDEDVEKVTQDMAALLRDLGAIVEDIQLPYVRHCYALQQATMNPEAATFHYHNHRRAHNQLGETAVMRLDVGALVPATAYIKAQQVRKLMRDEFRELLRRYEVIVGPALAMRPGPAGAWKSTVAGKEVDLRKVGPEYTGIYNLTGMPAISIPAGFSSEGTPIGFQIAGKWWDEATVLQVAHAIEQTTGWPEKRPPYPKDNE
jgi:aspartyl-tRNA(Asn)/glutamyl-tRNA(Gln) amidotransferase subunit A